MRVTVHFYSYFKELTGCTETSQEVREGSTVGELFNVLAKTFPGLEGVRHSGLLAVGVEYQKGDYVLRPGDKVSIFPPVQGG